MLKNYLLITLRNLQKNKLHIIINVLGMATAIACCVIGYFNYDVNASFDIHHKNSKNIYRVNSIREFQKEHTQYGIVPIALGNTIKQNIPDVEEVARYSPNEITLRIGETLFRTDIIHVDPSFFKLFTYDFIEGNGNLKNTNELCISDKLAKKYFGDRPALGQPITQTLDSGKTKEYIVAGIFKEQPSNSSFDAPAFSHYDNTFLEGVPDFNENSWRYRNTLFVQVTNPERIEAIQKQLVPYTENNNVIREDFIIHKFQLESFQGMGVRDSYNEVPGTWTRQGSPLAAIIGIGMMGVLILLIACFNLTNTYVAMSSRRLKEIGIRKVMGSSRKHLVFQFIGEIAFVCFVSLLLGIVLAELLLIPAFDQLWPDLKLTINYFGNPGFLIFMSGTLLFISIVSGGYPALYISKFQPTEILKGKLKFGGTNYFTRTLLTLQFTISLVGIVCSFAFIDNARYQREFDLGFNKNELVFTYINNNSEYETYRNVLLENTDILSIAGSEHHINSSAFNDPIKHEEKEIEVEILNISDNYLNTTGLTLLEGRDFILDSETDRKESVIVTEGLTRKLGLHDPVGKQLIWLDTVRYYIVGVVKDIYNRGLWRENEPAMFRYGPKEKIKHILVKAPLEKVKSVNTFMETVYKQLFPDRLYEGHYMDEELVEANTVNNNLVKMFIFLGCVALLLSVTGLFTLVSLNIIKKMKEIGVRKVLGASIGNISNVINREFIIILLIASILGGFAGAWMAEMLMDSIWDYYLKASYTTLIISAAILFVASTLSIGYKIYSTVKLNPARVLRDE